MLGPPVGTDPTTVVDTYSNQVCVLQSVHVVDLVAGVATSGATWGQVVTGEIQAAVAGALRAAVRDGTPDTGTRHVEEPLVRSAEQPLIFWLAGAAGVFAAGALLLRQILRLAGS